LLDLFGLDPTPDMQGRSLAEVIDDGPSPRRAALFGIHGGHVNVTDGRYVYMRGCATTDNQPLAEYTLMPTNMRGRFDPDVLARAELVGPLPFTKGVPVLKVPALAPTNPAAFGTLLFDLEADPHQEHPITDPRLEAELAGLLVQLLRGHDAPPEQFERLGLPATGGVTDEHLLARREPASRATTAEPARAAADRSAALDRLRSTPRGRRTVRGLLDDESLRPLLREVLVPIVDGPLPAEAMGMTLVDIATVTA